MERLRGKTALVTGSTDGVGRLVARKLGEAGARVLVHGRNAERGARVVADIEASGGVADFLAADLSAVAEVRRLADAARATVDRLDILINLLRREVLSVSGNYSRLDACAPKRTRVVS